MSEETIQENPSGGISIGDIYFVLFRRKWIIILCAVLGVVGAAVLFAIKPPRYRSEAQLLISYVMEGNPTLSKPGTPAPQRSLNEQAATILNTEGQIIKSPDVALQVVAVMGAARIMPKGSARTNDQEAADMIVNNLEIDLMPQNGGVISLVYQHPDPDVAREVLTQVIEAYVKKHKEVHRGGGMMAELAKETERLGSELALTDQQLREAKASIGGVDIEATKRDYADQVARIREQLFIAQTDMAKRQAALEQMPSFSAGLTNTNAASAAVEIPVEQIKQYRAISADIDLLLAEMKVLSKTYQPTATYVTNKQAEIDDAVRKKEKLEKQFPNLAALAGALPATTGAQSSVVPGLDPTVEAAQIKVLQSTTNFLQTQLSKVQAQAGKLDEMESVIQNLQRKKELQESDLKYFRGNLENFMVEDSLGAGKAPNIRTIFSPTPAAKAWPKSFKKKVQMVAVGGVFAGIALAFLIEMFLDRSVKRPVDVERKLKLPLFISIPDNSNGNGHARVAGKEPLRLTDARAAAKTKNQPPETPAAPPAPWERNHPLRPYYAGLRDRLITYFEVRNLNQKPKLVAVTSCGSGVGVSSIAAGLAASLSETGDGNVLLVDLSREQNASQKFHKGKPSQELDEELANETMKSALVQSEAGDKSQLPQVYSKRFANIMPKLKANEYDYIIFDMPAVSQTSTTPRMTRIMDMVLLVIESEKTSQDVVKQAMALLAESKANVSAVLNKTHSYVPSQLHQELNDV